MLRSFRMGHYAYEVVGGYLKDLKWSFSLNNETSDLKVAFEHPIFGVFKPTFLIGKVERDNFGGVEYQQILKVLREKRMRLITLVLVSVVYDLFDLNIGSIDDIDSSSSCFDLENCAQHELFHEEVVIRIGDNEYRDLDLLIGDRLRMNTVHNRLNRKERLVLVSFCTNQPEQFKGYKNCVAKYLQEKIGVRYSVIYLNSELCPVHISGKIENVKKAVSFLLGNNILTRRSYNNQQRPTIRFFGFSQELLLRVKLWYSERFKNSGSQFLVLGKYAVNFNDEGFRIDLILKKISGLM